MTGQAKILSLIIFTVLFISCSKLNNASPQTDCLAESLSEIYNGATTSAFFYTYDDQGRVTRMDYDSRSSNKYESITYSADKIVISGTALGNGTAVYELDANKRVTRYGSPTTFTYNIEGYLAKIVENNGPHVTNITFNYQNGNLVRIDQVLTGAAPQPITNTVLLEYDEAQPNISIPYSDPVHSFATSRSYLGAHFGKASKNLVKKETIKSSSMADYTRTHTYIRDAKGNITTIRTLVSDGRVGEKRLTYTCK